MHELHKTEKFSRYFNQRLQESRYKSSQHTPCTLFFCIHYLELKFLRK